MRIAVLFCGGTLVMEENERGVWQVPPSDHAVENLLTLEPRLSEIAELEVAYVDNIDSANITPAHWDRMADEVASRYATHDGFVVTHGTDTMAYTASALSFALRDVGKPVVFTGAQIPGRFIETDARRNFVNAVRIAAMDLSGVFVVFDRSVILGARATKVSESKLSAFASINREPVGEIRADVRFRDDARGRHDRALQLEKGFDPNITVATLFPGTSVTMLLDILEGRTSGLVLRAYGTGNIAADYLEVLRKARELGVPVVVTSQCLEGATRMERYEVGKRALDMGAIQAFDMSMEAIITKLMWVLRRASDPEKVGRLMRTDLAGEVRPHPGG
ncbi:MAG: type I asparaginase [Candidatus Eisenbacteria bacterium]|nr:type I asparaginase [Candidatus Eisenbacteria bacterium]